MPGARVHFLGTNGWYDTATGDTICLAVETDEFVLVLDAGNGLHKLDRVVDPAKPVAIFLSHLHLDHVAGLHILLRFGFRHPLRIFVPAGCREDLARLLAPPFTADYRNLPYPTTLHELPEEIGLLPCRAEVFPMRHTVPTLGIRLHVPGGIVAYCPDTGPCEGALQAARSADLLIAECAFRPGEESAAWPHLNPETAARLALEAGAGRLVLAHFDASRYATLESRREAEAAARRIFPETTAATDGLSLPV